MDVSVLCLCAPDCIGAKLTLDHQGGEIFVSFWNIEDSSVSVDFCTETNQMIKRLITLAFSVLVIRGTAGLEPDAGFFPHVREYRIFVQIGEVFDGEEDLIAVIVHLL